MVLLGSNRITSRKVASRSDSLSAMETRNHPNIALLAWEAIVGVSLELCLESLIRDPKLKE